jgi:hypothetical protein
MHPAVTPAASRSAVVFALRQHLIRDLLLLGREAGIQGLGGGDHFIQPGRALREALLLALQAFDRTELRAVGTLCSGLLLLSHTLMMLCHPLLQALVHVARVLAQHVRERIPLGLLGVRDLQGRAYVREPGFDALARHPHVHAARAGSVTGAAVFG